jgi:hypothetical protein
LPAREQDHRRAYWLWREPLVKQRQKLQQNRKGKSIRQERDKGSTFQTIRMIAVPNKLSTKTNKLLHQRLSKQKRDKKARRREVRQQ